jgi:pyrroloquinoline quinone (PQQ) biosynthesis protein C
MKFYDRLQERTAADRAGLLGINIIQDALRGRIELRQYVAFLTQAYHHVRHTAPMLMACGSRLPVRLEWLRAPIARYIEEEIGHDEWILSDIAACGGDPSSVRQGNPGLATEVMIAYAYHCIDRQNPVGFFGMIHVLEGTSTAIATQAADGMQKALGLPPAAFTYLASHGEVDIEHVKFFEHLMNQLEDPDDQETIVNCSRAMYRLYGDIFRSLPQRSVRWA